MKRRLSLATRLWRKFFPVAPAGRRKPAPPQQKRSPGSTLEPLEGRIAPATLVNASTISFMDLDGDLVTVKFSKDLFTSDPFGLAAANDVLKFTGGNGIDGSNTVPQQLNLIDLTKAPISGSGNLASGVSITITAKTAAGVKSSVDIGYIKGTGLPLGSVRVDGALTEIDCGNANFAVGLQALTVQSLRSTIGGETSTIIGGLGKLTASGNVSQAHLEVVNGPAVLGQVKALGEIGRITIGGSLIGKVDSTIEQGKNYSNWGLIQAAAGVGSVKIGSGIADGILGGAGKNAGAIVSGGSIGKVTISGGITGGAGQLSGSIQAAAGIMEVKMGGSLTGSSGSSSGTISGNAGIGNVSLGSLVGGTGVESGLITSGGTLGDVKIGGNIDARLADVGIGSGGIVSMGNLESVTVAGSIFGGSAASSGFIQGAADVGQVKVNGELVGGSGTASGSVFTGGTLASVAIGQSLKGGTGSSSGSILSGTDPFRSGDIGSVSIGLGMYGGAGASSGSLITTNGFIKSATIGSAAGGPGVNGGAGAFSGTIFADGEIGKVKISGSVTGGAGEQSAAIQSHGKLSQLTISGDLLGGSGRSSGVVFAHDSIERGAAGEIGGLIVTGKVLGLAENGGEQSAQIHAHGKLGRAEIGHLVGGTAAGSGVIITGDGALSNGDTGVLRIGQLGTATAGTAPQIDLHGRLASLMIQGDAQHSSIHAADGIGSAKTRSLTSVTMTTELSLAKLTVKGNVTDTLILAGYDSTQQPVNADAQIGKVAVSGDWKASSLIAGATAVEGQYGLEGSAPAPGTDSPTIVSRIASVLIKGTVSGTPDATNPDDHYGFVAQQIGSFKSATTGKLALNSSVNNQIFQIAPDVAVREIPLSV